MLLTRKLSSLVALLLVCSVMLIACSGPERLSDEELTPSPVADGSTPTHGTQPVDATSTSEPEPGQTQEPPATDTVPEATSPVQPTPDPELPEPAATATVAIEIPATQSPGQEEVLSFNPEAVNVSYVEAGSGFEQPVFVTHANDGSGDVYVLEKVGTVKRLDGTIVLDIRDQVVQTGVFGYEHEQGMLGLAFHPDFSSNRYFYVHYNDVAGNHVYSRFTMNANGTADRASEMVFLEYDQPEVNFQGGMLAFGSDGYLYVGTGTGGSAVELQFLAQDLDSIYGKILRLDMDSAEPYAIPPDNPFVSDDGDALPEIWAYGLRNPWRFSFDRATDDLYIGGPGQFTEEWIDFKPGNESAGQNFGWPIYEGTQCWESWTGPCDPAGLRMPILTYPTYQNGNCVVIGGYVHRGAASPLMNGAYFFGDFCSGNVWSGWYSTSGWQMEHAFQIPGMISSFGEDEAGDVYICDINNGHIYRITSTPR